MEVINIKFKLLLLSKGNRMGLTLHSLYDNEEPNYFKKFKSS